MLRWVAANGRRGELDGRRILPAAAYDRVWAVSYDRTAEVAERMRRAGRPMRYGSMGQALGWGVLTLGGERLINQCGADEGFRSDVLLWPAAESGVVVMTNNEIGDPAQLSQIIYEFLGRWVEDRTRVLPSLHRQG